MLADRQLDAGDVESARATVSLALSLAEETGNHYWDVELHRLLGDIELALPGRGAEHARACYRRALDIAHAQGARGPGRRAALSMSRLMAGVGERQEARSLLDLHWKLPGFLAGTFEDAEASQLLEQLA
jgi:adenylate cyclase